MIKLGQNNISAMYLGDIEVSKIYLGETQVYPNSQPQPTFDYLTFTAEQANSSVKYKALTNTTAEYSLDNGVTWIDAVDVSINLVNIGDSVKYRGVISENISTSKKSRFAMTGKIAASGSIMSMYNNNPNDTDITYEFAFKYMFYNCKSLTTAPELPATTLVYYCYDYMFNGCSSLTTAPELPATTLAAGCYRGIFQNCSSLTTAPELPATTLTIDCYYSMFNGCSSLVNAPELPATTLTLTCYYSMFNGCSSLTSVTHHITNWNTSNASSWLNGVAASGTVYCPSNSTIPADSASGIPAGWARVNI